MKSLLTDKKKKKTPNHFFLHENKILELITVQNTYTKPKKCPTKTKNISVKYQTKTVRPQMYHKKKKGHIWYQNLVEPKIVNVAKIIEAKIQFSMLIVPLLSSKLYITKLKSHMLKLIVN